MNAEILIETTERLIVSPAPQERMIAGASVKRVFKSARAMRRTSHSQGMLRARFLR